MSQSWLDRFSAHTTPAATPPPRRSFSPVTTGRPNLVPNTARPRPSLSQKSSTLSLGSELSGSKPTASPRPPNASSLRNQLEIPAPEDVVDPLVVLKGLLGPHNGYNGTTVNVGVITVTERPSDLQEDVDFGGLSLQDFVERESKRIDHAIDIPYNSQSVEEYDNDKLKYEELHKSILACDDVLKSVEKYLTSFQADLGAVSAEIETLQSRSAALNARLENRKKVEILLGPVVEQLAISPLIVKKIIDGPLDDTWMQALKELQARSDTIDAILKEKKHIRALDDLKPLLDDLSDTAIERIRNHFAAQIKSLRSPNINAQIIQLNTILKYRDMYTFLAKRQPQLAEDITQAYLNTMRWYYHSNFTRYLQAIRKLKLYTTDQHDVLGEDTALRGQNRSTLMSSSKSVATAQPDPFNLGRRIERLKSPSNTAMPSYAAEEEATKPTSHNFENPFLALNQALIDNASYEYSFLTSFFSPTASHQKITSAFNSIFAPTLELAMNNTKSLISDSYDALGVLLLVRLTQHFAFTMQRRKVPAIESYINGTNMLLWPRFQIILDANCESVRRLTASLPVRAAAETSTAPHPVTQRFANFLAGLLALSSEAGDDEPVSNSLVRLRSEFEAFLSKMAQGFGAGDKGKRQRFLMNNYSLILTVVADVNGKLAGEQRRHFEALREKI